MHERDPITIERLAKPDIPAAAAVLAAALGDEPGFVAVVPDRSQRTTVLATLFRLLVRDGQPLGHVSIARIDGAIAGTAVWYAPGDFPMTALRQLRMLPGLLPLLRFGARTMRDLGQIERNLKAHFPEEPCWYLAALGVAPEWQGRGVGSALMGATLTGIDARAEPAYLETGEASNVRFYEKRGFGIREAAIQVAPAPAPTHWTMWRAAATSPDGTDALAP